MSRSRTRQRGVTAVETAFLMPVILIGLMMFFELARLALVVVIGNLALDSALQGLRSEASLSLSDESAVAQEVEQRMLDASYGFLEQNQLQVRVTSYSSLAAFGEGVTLLADDTSADSPVLSVEADLAQDWITALPRLLSLSSGFTYTYRQVIGNLYQRVSST
ncbi:MAG: hypothetical protein GAK45_00796 [Pseudomonas citronellolis]|nr:MAG: hypothetical protein GAK45_00796 [Pseudomonas citronellolis]